MPLTVLPLRTFFLSNFLGQSILLFICRWQTTSKKVTIMLWSSGGFCLFYPGFYWWLFRFSSLHCFLLSSHPPRTHHARTILITTIHSPTTHLPPPFDRSRPHRASILLQPLKVNHTRSHHEHFIPLSYSLTHTRYLRLHLVVCINPLGYCSLAK